MEINSFLVNWQGGNGLEDKAEEYFLSVTDARLDAAIMVGMEGEIFLLQVVIL